MVYSLVTGNEYYFLSRPRRFGKSLFLDTLSELFLGNKELFEGLYIYDKCDWDKKFPVIKINFAGGDFSSAESISNVLKDALAFNCENYGISMQIVEAGSLGSMLERLIRHLYKSTGQKVVILIDEYDKPILDNITKEDISVPLQARDILRNFYSAIKASDAFLRFVFITGVSKFSNMNLFSGLNNVQDITLHMDYATITGYTHQDVEKYFTDYIEGVNMNDLKKWYNGYNYFGEPLYNPYDILLFFSNHGEFKNYWWETGNPSFLIEKLKEGDYFLPNLENFEASQDTLNTFDVEHIDLVALLWQTGYLTFDKKIKLLDDVTYLLKVPNLEVQKSLNALFLKFLASLPNSTHKSNNVIKSLLAQNMEAFKEHLISFFASIPYENYVNNTIGNYEGYYASVTYAFLSSLGFVVKTEESTNLGRVDMTMIGTDSVYILEFKVDMPNETALHQIETRKYHEKYLSEKKDIFLIGIHFDSQEKNISAFKWKKI